MPVVDTIIDTVHQILARDATRAFELARGLGFKMPREFDVGLRYITEGQEREGSRVRFHLRADDAVARVVVLVPRLDGRISLQRVDEMWRAVMLDLHRAASSLAEEWLNHHPEALPDEPRDTLERLAAFQADPTREIPWVDAELAARNATYEVKR